MDDTPSTPHEVVVVGAGMVAHRFVQSLLSRADAEVRVTVIGDEDRAPYDRSRLSSLFSGATSDDLPLDRAVFADLRVRLVSNDRVLRIDRGRRSVRTRSRRNYSYDTLVLATGSYATKAAVDGADLPGCFVYRTIDDVETLQDFVASRAAALGRPLRGAVVGGGLAGLEAAGALQTMDVETTVVESSDRLMPNQLDQAGGAMLKRLLDARGIAVRTRARTTRIDPDESGAVTVLEFQDGSFQLADVVVFAVGVRPRDELARNADLEVHPRGGILIDERCSTSDPRILAIGEVASFGDRCVGLAAPGHAMAEVAATRLLGGEERLRGDDEPVQLGLAGVDVATFGDALGRTNDALDIVYTDPVAGVYRKLVLSDDAQTLLGGILIGDSGGYAALRSMVGTRLGVDPAAYLLPASGDGSRGDETLDARFTGTASNALCAHFDMSRPLLLDAVRVAELSTFSSIVRRFGRGHGCDVCKPAIAGILSVLGGQLALEEQKASLREMNDHGAASMHKDGTCSVAPRMPGGEVTPDDLLAIGRIAKDFALRTKITGDQRIDLFGARIEQVPLIWARLVDAGFESGHVDGSSVPSVKIREGEWITTSPDPRMLEKRA